ncbi:MAG: hypothetical protein ACI4TW_03260 [Prevotella sp.]
MKRLQNRISESKTTLPAVACYGVAAWLAGGATGGQMWIQFACFVVSTALIMELNTSNALIRIYSRMVSCVFIVLSAMMCPLFHTDGGTHGELPATIGSRLMDSSLGTAAPDAACSIALVCMIAAYSVLFHTYQNRNAPGRMFYGYLFLGISSMLYVETLFFIPVFWLLTAACLQAASRRNFMATFLGLITPYWFAAVFFVFNGDFSVPMRHFARLAEFFNAPDYSVPDPARLVSAAFVFVLGVTGTVHFYRTSYKDKIRIRMLYNFFIVMNFVSLAFLVLQPCHYNFLIGMMILNTSPLIAHFISLTQTRITNIAFHLFTVTALLITAYNIWISL